MSPSASSREIKFRFTIRLIRLIVVLDVGGASAVAGAALAGGVELLATTWTGVPGSGTGAGAEAGSGGEGAVGAGAWFEVIVVAG